jgi:hypothetical protein
MKLFFPILLIALCSAAFAEKNKSDERVSVYFHPFTLATSLAIKDLPFALYLTGEIPLNGANSLIVNPSLYTGGEAEYLRLGSGIGLRRFTNKKSSRFYYQLMPSMHYMKIEKKLMVHNTQVGIKSYSGFLADFLGYIGYAVKFSSLRIFYDFGIGYGFTNNAELVSNGLALDGNIAIGLPF